MKSLYCVRACARFKLLNRSEMFTELNMEVDPIFCYFLKSVTTCWKRKLVMWERQLLYDPEVNCGNRFWKKYGTASKIIFLWGVRSHDGAHANLSFGLRSIGDN
jgi:hypothetical protein